jgi:hypothetical protein
VLVDCVCGGSCCCTFPLCGGSLRAHCAYRVPPATPTVVCTLSHPNTRRLRCGGNPLTHTYAVSVLLYCMGRSEPTRSTRTAEMWRWGWIWCTPTLFFREGAFSLTRCCGLMRAPAPPSSSTPSLSPPPMHRHTGTSGGRAREDAPNEGTVEVGTIRP